MLVGLWAWRRRQRDKAARQLALQREAADRQMLRAGSRCWPTTCSVWRTRWYYIQRPARTDAAANRFKAASAALDYADEPIDLERVQRVIDEARYSMDRARAVVAGRPPPRPAGRPASARAAVNPLSTSTMTDARSMPAMPSPTRWVGSAVAVCSTACCSERFSAAWRIWLGWNDHCQRGRHVRRWRRWRRLRWRRRAATSVVVIVVAVIVAVTSVVVTSEAGPSSMPTCDRGWRGR